MIILKSLEKIYEMENGRYYKRRNRLFLCKIYVIFCKNML